MATSVNTRLKARLIQHQNILEQLYETMIVLSSSHIQRFDLDTTEGEQEILEKRIDRVQNAITNEEQNIDHICSQLNRTGLISMNNRRR